MLIRTLKVLFGVILLAIGMLSGVVLLLNFFDIVNMPNGYEGISFLWMPTASGAASHGPIMLGLLTIAGSILLASIRKHN